MPLQPPLLPAPFVRSLLGAAIALLPIAATSAVAIADPVSPTVAQTQPSFWETARLTRVIREAELLPGSPSLLALSPDGSKVASSIGTSAGQEARSVRVWDVNTRQPLYTVGGHTSFIGAVAFSPDGRLLATGSYDFETRLMTIQLWDAESGRRVQTLVRGISPKLYGGAFYFRAIMAFSPDGQTLYTAAANPEIQVWDLNTGRLTRRLFGYLEVLRSLQVSPDGRTLASTHVDGQAAFINLETGQLAGSFATGGTDAYESAFSADGRQFYAIRENVLTDGHRGRAIGIWDTQTYANVGTIAGFEDESWIIFSPDGRTFADTQYEVGEARLVDITTNRELRQLQARSVNAAFSADGRTFAAVTPRSIRIWR